MAVLYRINADGSQAQSWDLDEKPVVFGRGKTVDAQIRDRALSRSHFLVVREGAGFFVVDLGSRNGTWVNGKRVSAQKLHPADIIKAGDTVFCFAEASPFAHDNPAAKRAGS
jgi:pSer/pThr/pTyr-binding forkhead associated (FHA) protein